MLRTKGGFVYMMTNGHHTVLYTGVTSNLTDRIEQHINGIPKGSFTSKYKCIKLVYYCGFPYIPSAIAEVKKIKGGSRKSKIGLIESVNPDWRDLLKDVKNESCPPGN
jgi:putative endonuclease